MLSTEDIEQAIKGFRIIEQKRAGTIAIMSILEERLDSARITEHFDFQLLTEKYSIIRDGSAIGPQVRLMFKGERFPKSWYIAKEVVPSEHVNIVFNSLPEIIDKIEKMFPEAGISERVQLFIKQASDSK